jgi:hypothetical protein
MIDYFKFDMVNLLYILLYLYPTIIWYSENFQSRVQKLVLCE